MDIRDVSSVAGLVVALGFGVYNTLRTRTVAGTVDTLLLQDKFVDTLRTALETQTLRTKEVTVLRKQRQRLRMASLQLSTEQKNLVDQFIVGIDKTIKDLDVYIVSDKAMVIDVRKLTAPEAPDPKVVKQANALLGQVRVRHSQAVLDQATTDGDISQAEDFLAGAQI
jgi:hypothetical protein